MNSSASSLFCFNRAFKHFLQAFREVVSSALFSILGCGHHCILSNQSTFLVIVYIHKLQAASVHRFGWFSIDTLKIVSTIAFHFVWQPVLILFIILSDYITFLLSASVFWLLFSLFLFPPLCLCWKYENNNKEETNNSFLQ